MSINEQYILTGAHLDRAIDLLRIAPQLVRGQETESYGR